MEQLANNPVTTLSGSINNSVTSMSVASGSAFPTSGDFTAKIGTELIRITGVSGTTWTIARGQEGTTAASHSSGDTVTQVVTSNVVNRLLTEMYQTGGIASLPATGRQGSEYYANDANVGWRHNGSNWDLIRPMYIPYANRVNVAGWTDLNNTGLTWNNYNGVYLNTLAGSSGANLRGKYHTIPSAPFTANLVIGTVPMMQAGNSLGFFLYDSGTTKCKVFVNGGFDNGSRIFAENWSTPSAYASDVIGNDRALCDVPFMFLRFNDDNTNWNYSISSDGNTWVPVFSETRNTYLTPTHCGIGFIKTDAYYSTNTMPFDVYAYWET